MCTLCAALRPDDATAAADLHLPATASRLPTYSLHAIADQLTNGFWSWAENNDAKRAFDLGPEGVLHYDMTALSEDEAFVACAALDAWADVTGIEFHPFVAPDLAERQEGADAAAGRHTKVTLANNQQLHGDIRRGGDVDWIKLDLVAGRTYIMNLRSEGDVTGLSDPLLILRNAAGKMIDSNDDATDSTQDSRITFTADRSGTYYLSAKSSDGWDTGDYTLTLTRNRAIDPDLTFDNSQDGAFARFALIDGAIDTSYINVAKYWNSSLVSLNSYWLQTYIHEIGHALGLGHAGNYNGSASWRDDSHYANDSVLFTVMSYFSQLENPNYRGDAGNLATVMPADIVAIQSLYHTTVSTRAGDTTYGANNTVGGYLGDMMAAMFEGAAMPDRTFLGDNMVFTLFDTGGLDRLDVSTIRADQTISLVPNTLSSVGGYQLNMNIARGTRIEEVVSGSGNDRITGNHAANLLAGGQGADRIAGGSGQDSLRGGHGNDRLNGGRGDDRLTGGTGSDEFLFAAGRDRVLDFREDVDSLGFASTLWGGGVRSGAEILDAARVVGGSIVFAFGGSNSLVLRGVSDLAALADDVFSY
ncbi:M10 family metallopeptidase C-terminal domain-containing protein [Gemmobacter fulvus]|uniref:M10 family metallopeptidase C-terminal domain-containing protein n=1 Tax=Gemmobacter fulvus TaxID=2840474 RepID=UPI002796633C|nr:M10 family metallopeptidase C-terminal domain-containing protein [Gemmobacter fulvus]MDQ1848959.1 M10 family metallopeptidase C-terminal domain-containing protein [Gemmobacter fulvus]